MINRDKEEFLSKCKDSSFVENIIVNFHKLYYYSSALGGTWKNTYWMGIPIQKTPTDCWIYQELIYKLRPDYIIETGTKNGGSALFFANICDMIGHGEIISVDIDQSGKLPYHERLYYRNNNSIDFGLFLQLKDWVKDKKVLVILDSDHSKNHVLKELELYSELVSIDSYLIVEDTNINGFPVIGHFDEGPLEAIEEFLYKNDNFKIDRFCEKFYLTFSPCGFLKRIK